jgi:transposase
LNQITRAKGIPPDSLSSGSALADKGYAADWFRAALAKRRIAACIASKINRKTAIPHDAVLYNQRHKIENMLGRLKTGGASTPDTTVAPLPTSRQSTSQLPSYSRCDQ